MHSADRNEQSAMVAVTITIQVLGHDLFVHESQAEVCRTICANLAPSDEDAGSCVWKGSRDLDVSVQSMQRK